uniref:TrbL/VirB6 plasmid conjugal transfer protein n=1 Tax=Candidatus Methylacidithermus pantelleriae TaxID=2744239 RepID=A0A8J2FWX3_9BACT
MDNKDPEPRFKLGVRYIAEKLFPRVRLNQHQLDEPGAYVYTEHVGKSIKNTLPGEGRQQLTPEAFLLLSAALSLVPTLLAFIVPAIAAVTIFLSIYLFQFLILVACDLAFRVIMALGLAMIPLVFFRSFQNIWLYYLKWLICIAMVQWLFFLCAGIGFSSVTLLYHALVDPSSSNQVGILPAILSTLWQVVFANLIQILGPSATSSSTSGWSGPLISKFFQALGVAPQEAGVEFSGIRELVMQVILMLLEVATLTSAIFAGLSIISFFVITGIHWGVSAARIAYSAFEGFYEAGSAILGHATQPVGLAERIGTGVWQRAQAGVSAIGQAIRGMAGE